MDELAIGVDHAMFIFQFRRFASASAAAITSLARSSPIETP
jgi:hypothetical protein